MRRISNSIARLAGAVAFSIVGLSLFGPTASLAASDSHCFSKSDNGLGQPKVVMADDIDVELDNTTDPERRAALEEFDQRHWAMRMAQNPWLNEGNVFPTSGGKRLMVGSEGVLLVDPYAAMDYDIHQERMSRRTGSKYIFISPAMKKLARERGQLRALKRKPCNPHILYLGSS